MVLAASLVFCTVSGVASLNLPFIAVGWTTPPHATTLNGTYVGRYTAEYDQDFFLGIPFAQPPVADLRFANPRSLVGSFSGVRNATEYSPQCVGYGVSTMPLQGPMIFKERCRTTRGVSQARDILPARTACTRTSLTAPAVVRRCQ